MLVVNRFRVEPGEALGFRSDLERAFAALSARPGFEDGQLGRNVDDPTLWAMTTRWVNVGSYRRALSSYEVKMEAVQTLSRAIEEPSAYESLDGDLNTAVPRDLGAR